MQLPRTLARFNRRVTNRIFGVLAGRVPPWVLVEHVGRRSGQLYRTVVWAFPHGPDDRRAAGGSDLVFVLTYGPDADWVRNVRAAGRCRVKYLGRWRTFTRVELTHGNAALQLVPLPIRVPLRIARTNTVLRLGAG